MEGCQECEGGRALDVLFVNLFDNVVNMIVKCLMIHLLMSRFLFLQGSFLAFNFCFNSAR